MRLDERSDDAAYAAAADAVAAADRVIVSVYVPPSVGSREDALPEALRLTS